jgi:predicted dehydrogenase
MVHIPAIRAIEHLELAAVCTSRPESAAAAADAYGVAGFHDVRDLAAQPDIDLIAVVVRVPAHHGVVMPALEAGKHVFCEWPLGANLGEAQEMAGSARAKGVVTAVGLEGRQDPALTYIKQLHDEGWLGDVLSVNMTMFGGGAGSSDSSSAWMGDAENGANLLTIVAGHSLHYLSHSFGPLTEVSASVSTQVPQWHLADTGETIDVDAPDNVAFTGTFAGGGRLSVHMASVPFNGSGWRMTVYGTEGTLVATTEGLPQITPTTLEGARGDEPLAPLPVPQRLRPAPGAVPQGPAANIARAYARIAEAIRGGTRFEPGFDDALKLHELLDALQHSSDAGRAVKLDLA